MGNESSQQLSGLEIDEKAVEVTDFWSHHSALLHTDNSGGGGDNRDCDNESTTPLSIFIGEPLIGSCGTLWMNQTPLEKATKNFMLHRHPCILKYMFSWHKGSKLYLAVEHIKPLAHVLQNQTYLQICIGLHSVAKAILFLHEQAFASHNNICTACVYVTANGHWKLGGLEYLCRLQDISSEYLLKTKPHRYERAIDPNEDKYVNNTKTTITSIDKYAFSVLVEEISSSMQQEQHQQQFEEFINYCKIELRHEDPADRPSFHQVLNHNFFTNNTFVQIYSFLTELPLKSESDKDTFFMDLATQLRTFPENIVARQLGDVLMARLVLLDQTAQKYLLPYILAPKTSAQNDVECKLFTEETFKHFIVPKLLHIFRVRDIQIRLLLLLHFKHFVVYFSKEQLQNHILPELLVGIKDTNDHLVSVTLVALSELVPILGASIVIGGNRSKLFNDGRPTSTSTIIHNKNKSKECHHQSLPERPSPDGGEEQEEIPPRGASATASLEFNRKTNTSDNDDLGNWSDWDTNNDNETQTTRTEEPNNLVVPKLILPDINTLDIKTKENNLEQSEEEIDFFQDMEPIIQINNSNNNNLGVSDENVQCNNSNFTVQSNENQDIGDGWDDEDLEWTLRS